MIDEHVPSPISYQRGSCQTIQELRTISNTVVTLNLPIVFVNTFIIVSNACLTVIIGLPIILTGLCLTVYTLT